MLAAVLSFIAEIPILYAGIINTILFAIAVFKLKGKSGNNAAIGLTSSLMISLALILYYIFPGQFNFNGLLFGDIVAANNDDALVLFAILLVVIIFFATTYRNLILTTLSKDVAHSQGVQVKALELLFLSILSFAVLTTIKIVGALLVTSIILIPAMIARLTVKSPSGMIFIAIIVAQLMNCFGITLSFYADVPFAPVIILCGGVMYVATLIINMSK